MAATFVAMLIIGCLVGWLAASLVIAAANAAQESEDD